MSILDVGAGASEGLDNLLKQRMLEEQQGRLDRVLNETTRHNQAGEANVAKGIEATAGYRDAVNRSTDERISNAQHQQDLTRTLGRVGLRPIGSSVSPEDRDAEIAAGAPREIYDETQANGPVQPGEEPVKFINFKGTGAQQLAATKQGDTEARNAQLSDDAAAREKLAADRLEFERSKTKAAQDTKDEKDNTIKVGEGGKRSLRSLDQAEPLIKHVKELMLKEAPDIQTNPDKYNTLGEKAHSLWEYGKYATGFSDQDSPRIQITKLLQPIQAGQYLTNSRSRQMLDLVLAHLADPKQTRARQWEAITTLEQLMPELREATLKSEMPVTIDKATGAPHQRGQGADSDPANLFTK